MFGWRRAARKWETAAKEWQRASEEWQRASEKWQSLYGATEQQLREAREDQTQATP